MANNNDIMTVLAQLTEQLGNLAKVITAPAAAPAPAVVKKVAPPKAAKRPVAPQLVEDFQKWFYTADEALLYNVRRGQWECKLGDTGKGTAHVLLFHSALTNDIADASDVIGIRPIGSKATIFNGSRITYGTSRRAQKQPQVVAEACGAIPIPFQNVVSKEIGAGLDLAKLSILDWQGSEKLIIPPISRKRDWTGDFYVVERHFAGAMVLKVENKYFLFDADREEVRHHGFNPFFTQLPKAAQTVAEAYEALMPDAVQKARANGLKIVRQGEFFFVPENPHAMEARILAQLRLSADALKTAAPTASAFVYRQLMERICLYGASRINFSNRKRLKEVFDFRERCITHTNGYLPEGTNTEIKAGTALIKLCQELDRSVGPEKAACLELPKEPNSKAEWQVRQAWEDVRNTGTLLTYAHHELNTRLDRVSERYVGGLNGRPGRMEQVRTPGTDPFKIAYNMNISSDDVGGGRATRSRNNHQATAVFVDKDGAIYAAGAVFHSGREHQPVYLEGWHRVYANTATANWTVRTGQPTE
jgi:hypothetical protein